MKFKDLSEKQIERMFKIKNDNNISWDEKMDKLRKMTGKSDRTVRRWLIKLGFKEKEDVESPQYQEAKKRKTNKAKKRFLITWCQNNTPIHNEFFSNLEAYAKYIDADIHVIAGRYKNPTSIFADDSDETWASRAVPYLDANRHDVHKYLSILSDIKVQPTAVNPMTSLETMTGENSCVIGHTRQHMKTVPVLGGMKPKIIMTTGACTKANYTDSKAGKKAEFHHVMGFIIVEVEDKEVFHIRQVSADTNGDFIDLINKVEYNKGKPKVTKVNTCEALVMGDIHVGYHDEKIIDKTFNFMKKVKPKNVILHDVLDFKSSSHHGKQDIFHQFELEKNGQNSVANEIEKVMVFLDQFKNYNTVIVRSNHDEHLDRWLRDEANLKAHKTPKNYLTYMKYASLIMEGKAPKGILPYLITERFPKFKALGVDESYVVSGYNLGEHGHRSANGSRGNILGFRRLNTKVVVGHYHSPYKLDGASAVGTSTVMRMHYNQGASSWLNSHVVIHENGKSQHINFIHKKDGTVSFTTFL